jgi:hypothetical protein
VRTYGKAISANPGSITTSHSDDEMIEFTWIERGENYYSLDYETDEDPKVPKGIKGKYEIGKNHPYIEYLGGKFYIIGEPRDIHLEVHHKILDPEKIKLKGLKH